MKLGKKKFFLMLENFVIALPLTATKLWHRRLLVSVWNKHLLTESFTTSTIIWVLLPEHLYLAMKRFYPDGTDHYAPIHGTRVLPEWFDGDENSVNEYYGLGNHLCEISERCVRWHSLPSSWKHHLRKRSFGWTLQFNFILLSAFYRELLVLLLQANDC